MSYNKEKEKIRKALYYKENREKVLLSCKKWQSKNKAKISEYNKKRYRKLKSHILKNCKKYRENNKEIIRYKYIKKYGSSDYKINHRNYTKLKYHTDPIYKIISLHRTRLRYALKAQNAVKMVRTSLELFGCDVEELKTYLEKRFLPEWNWGNHGKVWHIDHIKPLSKFDLTNESEQKKAFHYTNLQPLLKRDNLIKHNHFPED